MDYTNLFLVTLGEIERHLDFASSFHPPLPGLTRQILAEKFASLKLLYEDVIWPENVASVVEIINQVSRVLEKRDFLGVSVPSHIVTPVIMSFRHIKSLLDDMALNGRGNANETYKSLDILYLGLSKVLKPHIQEIVYEAEEQDRAEWDALFADHEVVPLGRQPGTPPQVALGGRVSRKRALPDDDDQEDSSETQSKRPRIGRGDRTSQSPEQQPQRGFRRSPQLNRALPVKEDVTDGAVPRPTYTTPIVKLPSPISEQQSPPPSPRTVEALKTVDHDPRPVNDEPLTPRSCGERNQPFAATEEPSLPDYESEPDLASQIQQ